MGKIYIYFFFFVDKKLQQRTHHSKCLYSLLSISNSTLIFQRLCLKKIQEITCLGYNFFPLSSLLREIIGIDLFMTNSNAGRNTVILLLSRFSNILGKYKY